MSPERRHWQPAVQAAAVPVMLRTSPVDGQLPASQPRPLPIYGAQFWERHTPSPAGHRPAARAHPAEHSHYVVISRDGRKLVTRFMLCCHSNATHAPIANPPNSAQLGDSPYHSSMLHPGPCNNVGIRPQTDTQTRVTTIHFASSTTHAKCNDKYIKRWGHTMCGSMVVS